MATAGYWVRGAVPGRLRPASIAFMCICLTLAPAAFLGVTARLAVGAECEDATITAPVVADSWIDEGSPLTNKGSDSILSIEAGSVDAGTGVAGGRSRALLRFQLPAGAPSGCVVESARLYLFSVEETVGTRLEVLRLGSGWSESQVSWSNQPVTDGPAVGAWSRDGYMRWNVTAQVKQMLGAANHGFLVRDAADGAGGGAGGNSIHSREHGDSSTPSRLLINFAAPSSGESPGPPLPPMPSAVSCGQVLTQSTLVTNDLFECLGDGLVVGAPRIIIDLGGHVIDGIGLGSGIRNDGYASVTVRNGTIQDFDYGVQLLEESDLNVVTKLSLRVNEVAAIEIFDVAGTEIRRNTLDQNGGGIRLVSGTTGAVVGHNTVTDNGGAGIFLRDSDANRLEQNSVGDGHDLGIWLERASGNTLVGNGVSRNSDGGIEIMSGSHGNRIEGNQLSESGDHGILVKESDRNELISNVSHLMSDSGIFLESTNDSVVRGNDVRSNAGGIQADGSSRNIFESNDASETTGIGIELGGGSYDNVLVLNIANGNDATGIYIGDEALIEPGNRLEANTASGNLSDGIVVAKGGHTLKGNVVLNNSGWGIIAGLETIDGGLNVAAGNGKVEQCIGVTCRVDWTAPETTITQWPADPTTSTSASFGFTGSDNTSSQSALRFQCSLDSAAFSSCTSPRAYTGLSAGRHKFEVRAIDLAGNTDKSPASHSWTVQAPPSCPTVTASSNADAWLDQNSPSSNHRDDSFLRVRSKSGSRNVRALVRFALPATPPGCVLQSATLRLYAGSFRSGRTLKARAIAAPWSESRVNWTIRPGTTGAAAKTTSGSGYRQWTVTTQVLAMYYPGANQGFLIRDAANKGSGAVQQFNSRENPNNRPQLVLRFIPAPP